MALMKYSGIGISSISTTVPKNTIKTTQQDRLLNKKQLEDFIRVTGVKERRVATNELCSSDLCYDAALKMFESLDVEPSDIDVLIFISQTPDYRVPGTSIILQEKLGLSTGTIAFDVNLTCSGYIYGLFLAYSLIKGGAGENVLLLVGETLSKITSPVDKATGLLLGDGGSATLISKSPEYSETYFSLNTDGNYYSSVIIPGGGFRYMSSLETLKTKHYEDGSSRNDEQIKMDGLDVFSFAVSEMPKDIKRILSYAKVDIEEINKFAFHQGNKYMLDFIAKKLKIDKSKLLYSIHNYGNTSGVSIPLTLANNRNDIQNNDLILMNAIGAGFSWGSIITNLIKCKILPISEI